MTVCGGKILLSSKIAFRIWNLVPFVRIAGFLRFSKLFRLLSRKTMVAVNKNLRPLCWKHEVDQVVFRKHQLFVSLRNFCCLYSVFLFVFIDHICREFLNVVYIRWKERASSPATIIQQVCIGSEGSAAICQKGRANSLFLRIHGFIVALFYLLKIKLSDSHRRLSSKKDDF